jgi:itaconate CoA-transferase
MQHHGLAGEARQARPALRDVCTGLYGAISILAALFDRVRIGRGTQVSVSMFDTMTELMGYALTHARYSGVEQVPAGMGSPAVAPYGAHRTSDDQVVVLGTTNDAEWLRLASLIDRPDLRDDPMYATNSSRVAHRGELDAALATWCPSKTLSEIQQSADAAGIGNARYNTAFNVIKQENLAARHRWRDVDSPVGPLTTLLPPPVVPDWNTGLGASPASESTAMPFSASWASPKR